MRHLVILAIALAAACGKDEPAKPSAPALTVPEKPAVKAPETPAVETPKAPAAGPSVDAAKAALDKSIADTKAMIAKKEMDAKALLDKAKSDPMKAMQYKEEADKLQKEIADLQTKLEGYMKEAAGK
jgi:hypothetical protein